MANKGIAPCGIDCANCELFEENGMTEVWERVARYTGKPADQVKCIGCRSAGGCSIHEDCKTLDCVNTKGLDYCFECEDFPCTFLLPAVDRADTLPHNLKVFNLCRIKAVGEEAFLKECARNRNRYFKGSMVLGEGPVLKTEF